jgi:hypothetical protein
MESRGRERAVGFGAAAETGADRRTSPLGGPDGWKGGVLDMAMTIDQLQTVLRRPNAVFYSDGDGTLLYPFPHQGQMVTVYIQLLEEGEYLRFFIPYYLTLSNASDRETIFLRLLDLNRQYKFLKFGVDPDDMEVTASIEIPIEDGTLTEQQVTRAMAAITSTAMQERAHMLTLISTGVYPAVDDPQFQKTLEDLLGEEDPEQAEGMEPPVDISGPAADAILEMDDATLTRLLEEIESDEHWEA